MEVSVTFRHMEPSTELRSYVEDKVSKIKKYFDSPVESHIVLKVEKFRHIADLTFSINGNLIKAVEQTGDMYSSIDLAMNKVEEQLRRFVSRKREYKGKDKQSEEFSVEEAEGQESVSDPEPKIIERVKVDVKPMDVEEAAMQMELSNRSFLVFMNSRSQNINVMYKRNDGNLGLIETSVK